MSKSKVIGMDIAVQNIQNGVKIKKRKALATMKRIGKKILALAKYYVPKDTRELERSGQVLISVEGETINVKILFGNEAAYYALYVHEDTDAFHKPPTKHHYLQDAVEELDWWIDLELESILEH